MTEKNKIKFQTKKKLKNKMKIRIFRIKMFYEIKSLIFEQKKSTNVICL